MSDMMAFPETPEEFIEQYSFLDKDKVYTNGSELIPVFRVEQMIEHYFPKGVDRKKDESQYTLDYVSKRYDSCNYDMVRKINELIDNVSICNAYNCLKRLTSKYVRLSDNFTQERAKEVIDEIERLTNIYGLGEEK